MTTNRRTFLRKKPIEKKEVRLWRLWFSAKDRVELEVIRKTKKAFLMRLVLVGCYIAIIIISTLLYKLFDISFNHESILRILFLSLSILVFVIFSHEFASNIKTGTTNTKPNYNKREKEILYRNGWDGKSWVKGVPD